MGKVAFISLWALVFSIPWENMLLVPGIGTITRLIGAGCLALAILAIIMEKRGRRLSPFLILFGIFVLWNMATFFWSVDLDRSQQSILSLVQLLLMVWLLWEFAPAGKQQMQLMQAFVLGAWFSAGATIVAYLHGTETYYLRYAAPGFDPNDLSLILALAVPMAWYLSLQSGRLMTWIYRLYIPGAFFAVTLTASRASFLALLVALSFLILTWGRLSRGMRVAGMVAAALLGVWIIGMVPASSWSRLMTIGSDISAGNIGSRVAIWQAGLEAFATAPLLGLGTGAFAPGVDFSYGWEASPHNLFLSILVGTGLVGLLVFLSMLLQVSWKIIQMPELSRRLWLVLLATWLVGVMTLGWELRKPTWFLLGLLAACSPANRNQPTSLGHAYGSSL